MADTIRTRRGTSATWVGTNPILALGERGFETDTGLSKTGDGVTRWVSLQYEDAAFSTRSDAVTACASGWRGVYGHVYNIGGVEYIGVTGSTIIPDLPGLEPYGAWTPLHFGAVGDGVADDGAALNAALAAFRNRLNLTPRANGTLTFDGLGMRYRSTVSINATRIRGWSKVIRNFTLISEAAGKNALDLIGSRGGILDNITVEGSQSVMPRVGVMMARDATPPFNFCDVMAIRSMRTRGYFSLAAIYAYGAESNHFDHCQFWNNHPGGSCGVHIGWDFFPVESDYTTAQTGEVSYIDNKYTRCEWRHFPVDTANTITGISKAAQAVITTALPATFVPGKKVTMFLVGGMTQINEVVATVVSVSGNSVTINLDTTGFSDYTSGGTIYQTQEAPTLVWGRGDGHVFEACYAVAYGLPQMVIRRAPNADIVSGCDFDILFEGAGCPSNIAFIHGENTFNISECRFRTYQTAAQFAVMSSDGTGSAVVNLAISKVEVGSDARAENPVIFNPPSRFSLSGTDVLSFNANRVNIDQLANFRGTLREYGDGREFVGGAVSGIVKAGGTWGLSARDSVTLSTVLGEFRYSEPASAWIVSIGGTVADFVIADAGILPNVDNAKSLGLLTSRWSTVHSVVNRTGLDLIVGADARVQFANDAGTVKGQFAYKTSTDVLTAAIGGTVATYSWTATAFNPATDNGQQLGLLAARWSTVHAVNVRATTYLDSAGTQVLSTRQSAIPDASAGTEVATINSILAALRAHGIIAT